MVKTGLRLLGAAIAVGTAVVWSWQPASVRTLSKMDSTQRSEYLSNLEASDVVGYYCDRDRLPTAAIEDVAASLRKDYGVDSVSCALNEAPVSIEHL